MSNLIHIYMEAKFAMGFRIHLAVNATIAELQHMRQAGSLGGVGHGVEGVVVVVVVAAVGLEKGQCYSSYIMM